MATSYYPRWAIAFLQKNCYKWWPKMRLGLYVVNLINLILKMAKKHYK
jgi:hypothetical protein